MFQETGIDDVTKEFCDWVRDLVCFVKAILISNEELKRNPCMIGLGLFSICFESKIRHYSMFEF